MKINIKNVKYHFIYFVLLLFCFMPSYITYKFHNITDICKMFQIFIIFFLTILNIKERKISKIIGIIIIYEMILVVSSLYNELSCMFAINNAIKVLSVCLLIDYGIRKQSKTFIESFEMLFFIFLLINIMTILMYPKGLYMNISSGLWQNWFLGYKNSHILYIFPLIMVSILNSLLNCKVITARNIFIIIMSCFNIIIVQSSTAYTVIVGIIIYVLCYKVLNSSNKLNAKNCFYTYLISFMLITVLRVSNWLRFVVVNIAKKDLTFTGRTKIWDLAIEHIVKKPILGHGEQTFIYRTDYNVTFSSTHSELLEVLFKTGLLGGIVYLYLIWESVRNLYINRGNIISKYLSVTLLILLIMTLFEAYTFDKYIYLFIIYYNVGYLIKRMKEEKKND